MTSKSITSTQEVHLADCVTPVAAYLKLRDMYAGSVLLESSDYNAKENSRSIIALNPLYEIIGQDGVAHIIEKNIIKEKIPYTADTMEACCLAFFQSVEVTSPAPMNGFLGYLNYESFAKKEKVVLTKSPAVQTPEIRYALYEFMLVFDHYNDLLTIIHNRLEKQPPSASIQHIMQRIWGSVPAMQRIAISGKEDTDCSEEAYIEMVKEGKRHCRRGDVFQVVLSRHFSRTYEGDEFMLYRRLRTINPSPYLFYFDYVNYQLLGSSPESQLVIQNKRAIMHPIAGTYPRSGNVEEDYINTQKLLHDAKENAEHNMLVDLARNDLSIFCSEVHVDAYKKIQMYSHVIHLVSTVVGEASGDTHPFSCLLNVSPAGTLSGAPKHRAMQLIDTYEKVGRGFYGGCVGMIAFNGDLNHAIIIRSCMLTKNKIHFRAGAGIVDASVPQRELQEVYNKINAIRKCFADLVL